MPDLKSNLSIDMQWFLGYLNGERDDAGYNEFALKRGYVNIKKKINDTFSGRITTDITQDKEGDGMGDIEMRLKYLYLKHQLRSWGMFHKPYLEYGLVHRPWIDFEESINVYRVQGTMFLERNNVINSGDYGVVFITLLGEEMDEEYRENVNSSFAGTWGSFSVGVFNGGGYHALEFNENKTVESRLTIRPLHRAIPGLQFTWHGAIGKGNIPESPDWNFNSGFVSYEAPHWVLTGEYYAGLGNFKGTAIKDAISFKSVPQNGFSLFGEYKVLHTRMSMLGRYDKFVQEFDQGDVTNERSIAGFSFHFTHQSKIVIDYDHMKQGDSTSHVFEVVIELKY